MQGNKTAHTHAHARTTKTNAPNTRPAAAAPAARRVEDTSELHESRLTICLFELTLIAGFVDFEFCGLVKLFIRHVKTCGFLPYAMNNGIRVILGFTCPYTGVYMLQKFDTSNDDEEPGARSP